MRLLHEEHRCITEHYITGALHYITSLATFSVPHRRFDHMHIDIVGPLPPSREGHTHLLTMVDRF